MSRSLYRPGGLILAVWPQVAPKVKPGLYLLLVKNLFTHLATLIVRARLKKTVPVCIRCPTFATLGSAPTCGSLLHEICQARKLEWFAIASRDLPDIRTKPKFPSSCTGRGIHVTAEPLDL